MQAKPKNTSLLKYVSRLLWGRAPAPGATPRVARAQDDDPDAADDYATEDVAVLRRVMLNRDKKVAGYEFFQIDAEKGDAAVEQAFLKFMNSVLAAGTLGSRRAFMTISAGLLSDPLLAPLISAGAIVMLRVDSATDDIEQLARRMQSLQDDGHHIGLADARVALEHPRLGEFASVGFLPVDQMIPPDLLDAVRKLSALHPRMKLCAIGVNSYEEFDVCSRLKMTGFVGPFATHRRDWASNKVDPGTVRLFNLVNSLRAGAEMDVIIKDIKLDPLLSYRILCHANSAAIGSQRKILDLKDAILLLGREPLFRWLVVLMCASTPNAIQNSALLENALARGRMMELLTGEMSIEPSEGFFLTGVLSLLDIILQVPSPALLAALDLPDDVKAALTERTGPYSALLRLVEASEQNDVTGAIALCTELGIEHPKFCEIQTEAMNWVREQSPEVKGQGDFADPQPAPPIPDVVPPSAPVVDVELAQDDRAGDMASDDEFNSLLDAAQRGEVGAQCALAARYATGGRVAKDLAAALAWYLKAAEQGDAKAQWNAAALYAQGGGGDGSQRDAEQAALWCDKAATQGFAPAQAMLGVMYAQGEGVVRDAAKAKEMLEKAARQDDVEAQYNLAVMFEEGEDKDLNLAESWLSQAAEQGLPAAQERLGLMFATGKPMQRNMVEAHKWFLVASQGGLESARVNLEHSLTLMTDEEIVQAKLSANDWLQAHQRA